MSRWGAVLALSVVVTAPVSQAQKRPAAAAKKASVARKQGAAPRAAARKVVLLDLDGDRRGKVRTQVESALRKTAGVTVVPLKQYAAAASRAGLRGAAAREPEAVKALALKLGLGAVVTGVVEGQTVRVRLLDSAGRELRSQDVALQKGAIPAAQVKALAADLALASTGQTEPAPLPFEEPPQQVTVPAAPEPEPAPLKPAAPLVAVAAVVPPQPTPVAPPSDAPRAETPPEKPPAEAPVAETPEAPAPDAGALVVENESHTTTEPAPPPPPPAVAAPEKPHPPVVRLFVAGSTTWRKYCARPGVSSCREFDAKPEEEQLGDTVDFDTSVPYLGVGLEVELLPLARHDSLWRGLGLVVGVQRGYSETTVQLSTPSGETPERDVVATDTTLTALAMYRYYFGLGKDRSPMLGYVGLRGGLMGRAFDVDEMARNPIAGTHRLYPAVGLEVSVPLARPVRIEGAGHVFFGPNPGEWFSDDDDELDQEVRDFGESVSSSGWSAELGLAGDLWGPLGYQVRFRLTHFKDTYSGAGVRTGWTQGGVAEETYSSLHWGLTASW
ncbi:hypothetical protein P2318_18430 [Myxococcaceae bacterium GXIMD 01537]